MTPADLEDAQRLPARPAGAAGTAAAKGNQRAERRADLLSGWWYMRDGETPEEHAARIKADPRFATLGDPLPCGCCDGVIGDCRDGCCCATCTEEER